MPLISLFYGIRVTMNYSDHNPPHFHAKYGDYQAIINILDSNILSGYLPNRQLKLVLAWTELHKDELMQDWELSREGEELIRIKPL